MPRTGDECGYELAVIKNNGVGCLSAWALSTVNN